MVPPNLPPPQAYTRDVLATAYEWLRSQPQSIRELASNSDNLVALYMQSRRRPGSLTGIQHAVTEASAEAFKQDLKALAEGMKQFDDASAAHQHNVNQHHMNSQHLNPQPMHAQQMPPPLPNMSQPVITTTTTIQQAPPQISSQVPTQQQHQQHRTIGNQQMTPPSFETAQSLDAKTVEIVRKVQMLCNLSSEREALRLLIAVGFERVREMFPRERTNKDAGPSL